MIFILIAAAVLIGTLMPVQAAFNAELTRFIKHPFLGAFMSFATGALALGVMILVKGWPAEEIRKLPTASPHLFLGGVLGALFVGSSIYFIPKMGATNMIASFVTGQLLMSVVLDHYGMLGLPVNTVNLSRIIGIFLLFAGLLLVIRKGA